MRVKQSRSRSQKIVPASLSQRRRSKRRSSHGSRNRQPTLVPIRGRSQAKIDPAEWLMFIAIGLISLALIALIWTLTGRSIDDQTVEIRARADQHVRSVATVLASDIHDELAMIDQSLKIVQEAWKKDSDSVDLGQWRKELLALTDVANDIFIANERHVIVQGTLPQSVGQGFGSAYVTYPNGSLEMFDPDGTKDTEGKAAASSYAQGEAVEARQFLMYVVRPLDRPRGWFVGASYRSAGLTKLFAGANLGQNGLVALADLKRGSLQAIVGSSARLGEMDIPQSELMEQMKKNDAGIWAGPSPTDGVSRIFAYQRIAGRDMAIMVAVSTTAAIQPLAGLAGWAHGLAAAASVIVLAVAGIVVWGIVTARATKRRARTLERAELNLTNARHELTIAHARALLTEAEAGTMLSSLSDGVARLDDGLRLRVWNQRFAELAGVPLDESAVGSPVEDLLRRQADSGLFGDVTEAEQDVATRLTILHTGGQSIAPPEQLGPNGEHLMMHVRGMAGGGHVILLAGPDNARLAALPVLVAESEPETVEETTEW
jgi:PAS domain-containing protein